MIVSRPICIRDGRGCDEWYVHDVHHLPAGQQDVPVHLQVQQQVHCMIVSRPICIRDGRGL
jgi:hypothetical protein